MYTWKLCLRKRNHSLSWPVFLSHLRWHFCCYQELEKAHFRMQYWSLTCSHWIYFFFFCLEELCKATRSLILDTLHCWTVLFKCLNIIIYHCCNGCSALQLKCLITRVVLTTLSFLDNLILSFICLAAFWPSEGGDPRLPPEDYPDQQRADAARPVHQLRGRGEAHRLHQRRVPLRRHHPLRRAAQVRVRSLCCFTVQELPFVDVLLTGQSDKFNWFHGKEEASRMWMWNKWFVKKKQWQFTKQNIFLPKCMRPQCLQKQTNSLCTFGLRRYTAITLDKKNKKGKTLDIFNMVKVCQWLRAESKVRIDMLVLRSAGPCKTQV